MNKPMDICHVFVCTALRFIPHHETCTPSIIRHTKLYRNGIVDNFNTCSRKSSNKPNNKSTINMRTTLIKFVIYYNHSNLTVLQKDVSHCVFQIQAFEACFSFAFWIFKTFFTIFCSSTKKARIIQLNLLQTQSITYIVFIFVT